MRAELYWITEMPYGRLATMPRPRAGDWLAEELRSLQSQQVDVLVSLLTDDEILELALGEEPSLCESLGLTFHSYPIPDRTVPGSHDTFHNLITQLYEDLQKGSGVAIHCRMGIGRASLVAASLLVKSGCSPAEAFTFISRARGFQVPDTQDQILWVESQTHRLRTGQIES